MGLNDIVDTMAGTNTGSTIVTFKAGQYYSMSDLAQMGIPMNSGALSAEYYQVACRALNEKRDIIYDWEKKVVLNDTPPTNDKVVEEKKVEVTNNTIAKEEIKEERSMSEEIRRQLAFGTDEGKEETPIIAGQVIDGKELAEKFRGQELRVTNMDTYIKKGNTLEDGTYVAIQVDVMGENNLRRWVTAPFRCLENIKEFIKANKYTADGQYSGAKFPKLFEDEEYYIVVADQDAKLSKDGEHWNAKYDIYKK